MPCEGSAPLSEQRRANSSFHCLSSMPSRPVCWAKTRISSAHNKPSASASHKRKMACKRSRRVGSALAGLSPDCFFFRRCDGICTCSCVNMSRKPSLSMKSPASERSFTSFAKSSLLTPVAELVSLSEQIRTYSSPHWASLPLKPDHPAYRRNSSRLSFPSPSPSRMSKTCAMSSSRESCRRCDSPALRVPRRYSIGRWPGAMSFPPKVKDADTARWKPRSS
mmetsp:Transcript_28831/g.80545  ORF Transcript_28831/g.80545 Transcript_28831/m.80545 type:complete len:222 (+) Transcript_28831:372-1037(+)